jgi:hypothetical protein
LSVAENVKIDLSDNSPYRVALELATRIANSEGKAGVADRSYWLRLYLDCRRVVLKGVLPKDLRDEEDDD